ncbi:hypothetical protein F5Y10DRAFT_254572 [Nemania abortiva]|nr:hypothetical protein F5Y10DRAFT_254572 [Nemania abortiva]
MKDTKLPRKRRRLSSTYHTKRPRLDFYSNELMQGPPNHTAEDFEQPRLRKCPFRLDAIKWESATKLGDGYDGCAWKVTFKDQGTFVLKVFWDLQPPQTRNGYFAPRRECQNAAILQMIEAALEEGPVPLPFGRPKTQAQAIANMLAFSVPRDNMQQFLAAGGPQVILSQCPPIRRCYGWIDFDGDLIKRMPYRVKPQPRKYDKPPRSMSPGNTYHAIVYEYISEDDNDPELIKALLRFFYFIGFSFTCSPRIENWKGGKLIDGSDVVYPGGVGWDVRYYGSSQVAAALLGSDSNLEE